MLAKMSYTNLQISIGRRLQTLARLTVFAEMLDILFTMFVSQLVMNMEYEYGIIKFHLVLLGRVGFNFVVSFYLVSFVGQESYTNLLTVHFLGRY